MEETKEAASVFGDRVHRHQHIPLRTQVGASRRPEGDTRPSAPRAAVTLPPACLVLVEEISAPGCITSDVWHFNAERRRQ